MKVEIHNHTNYSDGKQTVNELIERAMKEKVDVLSITDHDSVGAYLHREIPEELGKMRIIPGVEIETSYKGVLVEVLGYYLQPEKMEEALVELKSGIDSSMNAKILWEGLNRILDEEPRFIFDRSVLIKGKPLTTPFFTEIMSHLDNREFKELEQMKNLKDFIRKGINNPQSTFFIDRAKAKPAMQDVIDAIHYAYDEYEDQPSIAFLAHPFWYYGMDIYTEVDSILSMYNLDGIECYYPSFTSEQSNFLHETAGKKGILVCGGNDDHNREGEEIYRMGNVKLPICEETKWLVL